MAFFNENSTGLWAEQYQGALLDYSLNWADLCTGGDTLKTSVWLCTDPVLQITNQSMAASITGVWFSSAAVNTWFTITNSVETNAGRRDERTVTLFVKERASAGSQLGSALFPNKFTAIAKMRRDRLLLSATATMPSVDISDEYVWDKLRAAESDVAHTLRVPLAPTAFFPSQPTPDEITALGGTQWGIDPGYDYSPEAFGFSDKWGMLKMRNKPLQSVSRVRFSYPGGSGSSYDLPLDWLRMDKKAGTIQFVPSSTAFVAPLNAFVMQAIGNGRTIPLAIQISYVAGLTNAAADYPELLDAVMKLASLKIIEDAFLPQSGSISADGLSQSMSVDMDKHHDTVDRILNGGKGSNGGLMTAIHGVRIGVLGS